MHVLTSPLIFSTPTFRFHASPLCCSLKPPPPATDDASTVRTDAGRTRVSGIHVPRQKYISVQKNELLEAVISSFETEDEAREFARFSRCLDSLLHAEHKVLLEELRLSYSLAHLPKKNGDDDLEATSKDKLVKSGSWKNIINGQESDKDNRSPDYDDWDMRNLFGEYIGSASAVSDDLYRVDKAAKFQHAFMKILRNAQFEEISAEDLLLTRALKTDYLLTLPIYVDWKKAMESNAIIFRRGYATESQKGLLLVEKLDHLQSKLLQEVFFLLAKPLKRIGVWITEVLKQSNDDDQKINRLIEKAKLWLIKQYIPPNLSSYLNRNYGNKLDVSQSMDNSLPIWLASQRAVPLYEGLLSSVGPRGRLIRKLLSWTGVIPSVPDDSFKPSKECMQSEEYLRRSYLSRVTISDIWRPATKEYCGNNVWKMFKTAVSILFRKSLLQEPAFQELILFYTGDGSLRSSGDKTDALPLHLMIYEKIPIPDLPVIFPNKKLSFRILDTVILPLLVLLLSLLKLKLANDVSIPPAGVACFNCKIRLDIASILGLLAYFLNYKFESTVSSPSAFLLDVVAISALIIYGSRVALGYKQTWDRYQLLVNRTLYEKTLASGFGSVHFLLDASEQQQYKEAILAYAFLLREGKYQASSRESIKDKCEKFIFDKFAEKVEMPIDSAVDTLMRFDIAKEVPSHDAHKLEAVPCSAAFEVLKEHWDKLLQQST